MTFSTLAALVVVVVLLWQRVEQLSRRMAALEKRGGWRDEATLAMPTHRPSGSTRHEEAVAFAVSPAARSIGGPVEPTAAGPPIADRVEPLDPHGEARSRRRLPGGAQPEFRFTPEPAPATARRTGFEDIFGRKLPLWAGGITLAVCGLLIVKYSIDAGLLSPLVRVVGALLFGAGLIAGAEAALRNDKHVRDPRVRIGIGWLYSGHLPADVDPSAANPV